MAPRIKWSEDGSLFYFYNSGSNSKVGMSADSALRLDSIPSNGTGVGSSTDTVMINFPATVTVDKVIIKNSHNKSITIKVSADSTDGLDGTWTTVVNGVAYAAPNPQAFAFTPGDAKWMRIGSLGDSIYAIHIFGEYKTETGSPRAEFWAADGSAELNATDYPLSYPAHGNASDAHEVLSFKLKNTHSASHDYTLSVIPFKYGGDALVTNNIKLSLDGGTTKTNSVNISALAAGALSAVIGVYLDLLKADNPADDTHQWGIKVVETA